MVMVVEPPLTKYTMRSGREASVGRRSLYRQRRSSTSSVKPRNIIQQMDRIAQINWENCYKHTYTHMHIHTGL